MRKNDCWLQWAIELQSLAQAGLTYGKDVYDKERYERIREISAEIISRMSDIPTETVKNLFCNETGYQTPKLDTRAAIFKDDKILLVYGVCKVFVLCSVIGGNFQENIETKGFDYFSEDNLPALATEKNNEEQIRMCFDAYRAGDEWKTIFD